jgi:hypothetical protein
MIVDEPLIGTKPVLLLVCVPDGDAGQDDSLTRQNREDLSREDLHREIGRGLMGLDPPRNRRGGRM